MFESNENKISKIIYTVIIFAGQFSYGLTSVLVKTNLVDFEYVYQVEFKVISHITTSYCVGYVIGSLAGFTYKWINRQLLLSCLLMLMAITTIAMPFYVHVEILFIAVVLFGTGCGAFDSSMSAWLVEIWPSIQAVLLQAVQFLYGVGSILSPLISAEFVYGKNENVTISERQRSLAVPYGSCGGFLVIVSLALLGMHFIKPYKKSDYCISNEELSNVNEEPLDEKVVWKKFKIVILGLSLATFATAENSYFTYSASMWQYLPIQLSAKEASRVLSISSTTFTLARLINSAIMLKVKPDVLIIFHYVFVAASLVFLFFGKNERMLIYVGNALIGYSFSPVWPCIQSFTQRHFGLTPRIGSFFSVLFGISFLVSPFILNPLFEDNPVILFAVNGLFLILSIIFYTIVNTLMCITRKKKNVQLNENRTKVYQ